MPRPKRGTVELRSDVPTYFTIAGIVERAGGTNRAMIQKAVDSGTLKPVGQTDNGTLLFDQNSVNIDVLRGDRIRKLLQQAQTLGISPDELMQLANEKSIGNGATGPEKVHAKR